MKQVTRWLSQHKFTAHTVAFLLMILPPIPLYFAAEAQSTGLIWALIAPIILGSVLVIFIK